MTLEDIIGLDNAVGLRMIGSDVKNLVNSIRKKSLKIVPVGAVLSLTLLVAYLSLAPYASLAQGSPVTPTPTPTPASQVFLPLLYKNAQDIFATPTPTPTPVLDSSDAFMSDFFYCDVNYTTQVKTIDGEVVTEYHNAPNQVVLAPDTGKVLSVESIAGNSWNVSILFEPVINGRPYGSFISDLRGLQTLDSAVKVGEILFARDPIGHIGAEESNLAHKFSRKDTSGNFVSGDPNNFGGKNYWLRDTIRNRPDCLPR